MRMLLRYSLQSQLDRCCDASQAITLLYGCYTRTINLAIQQYWTLIQAPTCDGCAWRLPLKPRQHRRWGLEATGVCDHSLRAVVLPGSLQPLGSQLGQQHA